jgi:hypothetical protein
MCFLVAALALLVALLAGALVAPPPAGAAPGATRLAKECPVRRIAG